MQSLKIPISDGKENEVKIQPVSKKCQDFSPAIKNKNSSQWKKTFFSQTKSCSLHLSLQLNKLQKTLIQVSQSKLL